MMANMLTTGDKRWISREIDLKIQKVTDDFVEMVKDIGDHIIKELRSEIRGVRKNLDETMDMVDDHDRRLSRLEEKVF